MGRIDFRSLQDAPGSRRIRISLLAALLLASGVSPAAAAGFSDLNVGISLFNDGRYGDAIAYFDKAIAAGDLVPDQMHVARLYIAYKEKKMYITPALAN